MTQRIVIDPVSRIEGHAKITIYLDDAPVTAERGEPLAVALLGAGKITLARSPKLHRPRAPSCLRGACDGCLARVDGVPNVMTCLRAARGGEMIVPWVDLRHPGTAGHFEYILPAVRVVLVRTEQPEIS